MFKAVRTIFSRVLGGLTLLGALMLAVLPMGQMPKVAGPCGKALCYCLQTTHSCELCPVTQEPVKPKVRWLIVDSQLMAAESGVAFYPVFNDLGTAPWPAATLTETPANLPTRHSYSPMPFESLRRDIPTPPPRA